MTDPARSASQDPVMRRVREAFAHMEPRTEMGGVVKRAARYLSRSGVVSAGGIVITPADLAAAKRSDPAAVTRIYQAYAPALLRFFVAAVGDRHAAEDLTGTVFAAAVEALPGFRAEADKLGGWLFRIARHDLYDYRRRVARVRTENLDGVLDEAALVEDAPPLHRAIERFDASKVMAALERLSPDQREVLTLRLAAGLTAPEVAATLGKTTGAVKSLQHRGMANLGRALGLLDRASHPSEDPEPSSP